MHEHKKLFIIFEVLLYNFETQRGGFKKKKKIHDNWIEPETV